MKNFTRNISRQWSLHLMLIPAIVLVFIFSYIPLYGLVLAFQKYNPAMGFGSPWIGLNNYRNLFAQPNFVRTIWNTFFIATMKIIGGIIVPVFFSLLLNEMGNRFFKRFFQTIIYIPNFLSWVIMAGIMVDLLGADGVVNQSLGLIGIGPIWFLGEENVFPWTMIVSDIWKTFGFGTVIYLAALTSIDPGLYEAAEIDGAGLRGQLMSVVVPIAGPGIAATALLCIIFSWNEFFYAVQLNPVSGTTVPVWVTTYVSTRGAFLAKLSAASVLACIPVVLAGWIAQKRLIRGLALGAIK